MIQNNPIFASLARNIREGRYTQVLLVIVIMHTCNFFWSIQFSSLFTVEEHDIIQTSFCKTLSSSNTYLILFVL